MFIKCRTDKGAIRNNNEDYVLSFKSSKYTLLIVADGMGGHNAGEIASKMAAIAIRDFIFEKFNDYDDKEELIRDAIVVANKNIYCEQSQSEILKGMGTTTTCLIVCDSEIHLGHVGDSRAYIVNNEGIRKITQDHSYVQELINNGSITEDEAFQHPQRNLITRAVGTEEHVIIDTKTEKFDKGDIIVICSDGLTDYVSNQEIWEIVTHYKEAAADVLVDMANKQGGRDNISVIIAGKEGE